MSASSVHCLISPNEFVHKFWRVVKRDGVYEANLLHFACGVITYTRKKHSSRSLDNLRSLISEGRSRYPGHNTYTGARVVEDWI